MRKTVLRAIGFAVITTAIIIGCGDSGNQDKTLNVGEILSEVTGGESDTTHYYTLTVNEGEGGNVSRSSNNTSYKAGERVTVTATPSNGYIFNGWEGDLNDTAATVVVTVNGNLTIKAKFIRYDIPTYTLTINSDGGNVTRVPNSVGYTAGEEVTLTAMPIDDCYKFIGWSGAASGTDESITVSMNKDLEIKAVFQQQTYTLTLGANNSQGGKTSRVPDQASYTCGEKVIVTATEAPGYTFVGWSSDSELGTTNPATITIDNNKTLTANFRQNIYTVATAVNTIGGGTGGSVSRNPNKETYAYGESVTITATETPPSGDVFYRFTGWTGTSEKSPVVTITIDKDTALTANFQKETVPYYTLNTPTYPLGIGTIVRNPDNASYKKDAAVTVTAPKINGYEFINWSGASSSENSVVTITMDENKTLTANYRKIIFTLSVEYPSAAGNVYFEPYKSGYTYDENVTVIAEANPGYEFTGWSGASTSDVATVTITMNDNKKLIANFTPLVYKLNAYATGSGDVSISPNKEFYNYNDQVIATYKPKDCYTFSGWSGTATGTTNNIIITMNDNKTLIANFQQNQYILTTNVSTAGSGTTSHPNQTNYNCGTTINVTATPANGYEFKGWSGATTSATNPAAITIDGNKTLTAVFQPITYTITYNLNGGTVTSPNPTTYTIETPTFTLNDPKRDGYRFNGWTETNNATPQIPLTIPIGSTGNKNYTANWTSGPGNNITYNLDGGTVTPVNPSSYTVETPTFTLNNPTRSCYTFAGWTGSNGMTPQTFVTVPQGGTTEKNYTANWTVITYNLTTSVSPSSTYGSVSRSPSQTSYACGTSVTLTAVPTSSDYAFDSWVGAPSGVSASSATITFDVNSNVTLTAKFKIKRIETVQFPTVNSYPYIWDKGFPASVEVYAFGAGGGASGGSINDGSDNDKKAEDTITGGGGGGGAAVYAKFSITSTINNMIYVKVGNGGTGGDKKPAIAGNGWQYGYPGSSGGASTVVVGNISSPDLSVTAGGGGGGLGGIGGNVSNPDPDRGYGGKGGSGSVTPKYSSFLESPPVVNSGKDGNRGAYCDNCKSTTAGKGGTGGTLPVNAYVNGVYYGDISAGKGGNGQPNNVGTNGEKGQVIIKFTWWE